MPSLPRMKPGQTTLSAARWNHLIDTVRANELALANLTGESVGPDPAAAMLSARKFTVSNPDDFPDTIECFEADGFGGTLHVAKPWLLRRMPFDKELRNKVAYIYSSNTERQARKKKSGEPGEPDPNNPDDDTETSEQQIVIPRYVVNDVIYAVRGVARGAEAYAWSAEDAEQTIEVSWIDLNIDGRYWARKSGNGS